MHGDINPRQLDERAVRHWQNYGRGMERVAAGMGLPGVSSWLALGRPSAIFAEGEPAI